MWRLITGKVSPYFCPVVFVNMIYCAHPPYFFLLYLSGSRAGYVFMSGKKGQGYYFDTYKTDLQEREETLKAVLQDASKEKKKLKAADVTFANTLCFELD